MNVILLKKFLYVFVFMGAIPSLAQMIQMSIGWLPSSVVILSMIITLIPEISCIYSRKTWSWVKGGIENADGRLHKSDLGEFLGYYGTFIILRCFAWGFLMVMVGIWENPDPQILYSPLAFAASGGALAYISKRNERGK